MKQHIIHFATEHPKRIFWGLFILSLAALIQLPRIVVDTDPENMLPGDQPQRVIHDEIKERFKLYDLLVVGIVNTEQGIYNTQSLRKLKQLSDSIEQIDGVISHELMSLASVDNITQEGPGSIRFDWLLPKDTSQEIDPDAIREAVNRLPLFVDTLVSSDDKAASIYVPIKAKELSHQISIDIQDLIDQLEPGAEQYHITGLPVAEDTFGVEMFIQMAISAPLAGLAIFLLMWWFFRSFALISAPMIVAMATVIITMGTLIGMGFTVHIMSSMIPIFLMPIAVVDSVHILSEFAEVHRPGSRVQESIETVVSNLFRPMLFTSITSAVGFASLAFTPIPPVQVFGLFVAFGIALAFIFTIIFVPAYIAKLSPARIEKLAQAHHARNADSFGSTLSLFKSLSRGWRAKGVLFLAAGLSVVSYLGIMRIEINDNPVRWFQEDHRIRVADRVLNQHFAGTYDAYIELSKDSTALNQEIDQVLSTASAQSSAIASLISTAELSTDAGTDLSGLISRLDDALFSADDADIEPIEALIQKLDRLQIKSKYFLTPEALTYLDSLQTYLNNGGLVGKSNSLSDLIKTVYRELKGGDESDYRIPDNAAQSAQTILSYQSSHRPYDLWHFVSSDYRHSTVWLQLKSGDNQDMSKVIEQVNAYISQHPLPEGVSLNWGGLAYINVVWQEAMVTGMLESLVSAFIAVFVVMVILFRSLAFGILAMIPLSLTIALIYGLIGWIGKDYDMPVAVLSSLTLGLSVDFAIHFLDRARALYSETGSWTTTLESMFQEPALAILRNAIVIAIGFLPLLAAPLVPYNTVGIFLASIMTASSIVTLVLLPPLIHLFRDTLFRTHTQLSSESAHEKA